MNMDEYNDEGPRREELAAYVDEELDLIARLKIERWLACNPDAAREVEAQHYFCELWRATGPADPVEFDWALAARRCADARQRRRPFWHWLALPRLDLQTAATTACAATLLLAIILGPLPPQPQPKPAPPTAPIEVFPVLASDDVEIISVDPADVCRLVVGEAPLREPIVPMASRDIHFTSLGPPDTDGAAPRLRGAFFPVVVPSPHRDTWKEKMP
jgi:hypothetical protein